MVAVANLLNEFPSLSLGDPEICIAVLDGVVDQTQPSLVNAALTQVGEAADSDGLAAEHGTLIASVLFGQADSDVRGMVPACRGISIPIFHRAEGGGIRPASQIELAHAINWALDLGADIINISGGQFTRTTRVYPVLEDVIARCHEQRTLIVAAAGNDGCSCVHIPAVVPNVLAVGASDSAGQPLQSSNWGPAYKQNGLLAPGEDILGAGTDGTVRTASGTSLATAVVTGVIGLLMSLQKEQGQQPDPVTVSQILLDTADTCDDNSEECQRWLAGKLNLPGAIGRIMSNEQQPASQVDPMPSTEQPCTVTSGALPTEYQPEPTVETSIEPSVAAETKGAPAPDVQVRPSACSCNCNAARQPVFVLGQLGFDYGLEARRDSLRSYMGDRNPDDPRELLAHLKSNPWDATAVIWTLNFDQTPVYSLRANGPYAKEISDRIIDLYEQQINGQVGIVSIPGYVSGSEQLLRGPSVPTIEPQMRGLFAWIPQSLVKAVAGEVKSKASKKERDAHEKKAKGIASFLDRVYYELRNLGRSPQERAINFAATNAFNIERVYEAAKQDDMDLDSIEVDRSPICRPDSDCWDVKLNFFFPDRQVQTVRRVYRFTVDVSDVVPVTIGKVRSWYVR